MSKVTIVGAGLSGLMAAITLARNGHEVKILERENQIGGVPELRPDPAGSPFDIEGIKRFTGVDIAPAAKLIDESTFWAWGKPYRLSTRSSIGMYMVERGSRSSSVDSLLLAEAEKLGVDVRFGQSVVTRADYANLPPDTIVATGLHVEPYEALNIPYSPLYGYYAKGTVDHDRTTVSLWMDTFTRDYAFNCTVNGVSFALLFQRGAPLNREGKKKYVTMLAGFEGLEFNQWNDLEGGACPVGDIRNPRLFHGNKILAGTLAGAISPFMFFGMLGALVTGHIAARAIEDRTGARDDFRKAVRPFYQAYLIKKAWDLLPTFIRRPVARAGVSTLPRIENFATRRFANSIPGWRLTQFPCAGTQSQAHGTPR